MTATRYADLIEQLRRNLEDAETQGICAADCFPGGNFDYETNAADNAYQFARVAFRAASEVLRIIATLGQ